MSHKENILSKNFFGFHFCFVVLYVYEQIRVICLIIKLLCYCYGFATHIYLILLFTNNSILYTYATKIKNMKKGLPPDLRRKTLNRIHNNNNITNKKKGRNGNNDDNNDNDNDEDNKNNNIDEEKVTRCKSIQHAFELISADMANEFAKKTVNNNNDAKNDDDIDNRKDNDIHDKNKNKNDKNANNDYKTDNDMTNNNDDNNKKRKNIKRKNIKKISDNDKKKKTEEVKITDDNTIFNNDIIEPCGKKRCMTCNDKATCRFSSTVTNRCYNIINPTPIPLTCSSSNIVYLITCSRCGIQYVGETKQAFHLRMNNHRCATNNEKDLLVCEHFNGNGGCDISHMTVQPIEQILGEGKEMKAKRLERECFWIKELRTLYPYGLNDRLDNRNWRFRWRDDIAGKCFNKLSNVRGARGGGTQKRTKGIVKHLDSDKILTDLSDKYENLQNWRHFARCIVNSIEHSKLRDLSWVFVQHYHDCRTTYPREITNLMLDMINYRIFLFQKEKKQVRRNNFVKVKFQSKMVEKVNISYIFRKHVDAIPSSFSCRDSPTVLFQLSKSISSTVFNYKDVVMNTITEDWKYDNVNVCDCEKSLFRDDHHQHVVTGDLRIITNKKIRALLCKGPSFREAKAIDWDAFLIDLDFSLNDCVKNWACAENVDIRCFDEWKSRVFQEVKAKVDVMRKSHSRKQEKSILADHKIRKQLEELQKKFVFVQTDKAGNNIAVICKKFYIEKSMEELKIFKDLNDNKDVDKNTYEQIDIDRKSIINRHRKYLERRLGIKEFLDTFPYLYWIPKMHKKPYSKQRYIAASSSCTTKHLSAILTKCFKVIEKQHRFNCRKYEKEYNVNLMWIVHNTKAVHENIATFNRKKDCNNIRTYDFSTLYTAIPHTKLKRQLSWVIGDAFKTSGKKYISVYKNSAGWTDSPRENTMALDCKTVIELTNWLISNIYVTFGDKIFRQKVGIPMGTDCAPFLANLFLYSYEYKWLDKQRKLGNYHIIKHFKNCSRYIDDIMLINNNDLMKKYMTEIYPKELFLVPDDSDGMSTPFLDLQIVINDGIISTSIFDKRDGFDFPIVNFPFLSGNIPQKSSYGVFIGELVRYARACTYLIDFRKKLHLLVTKLRRQFFTDRLLKRTFMKFCESHHLLIQKYGPTVLDSYDSVVT
jgi:hypothetical protein